jgi:hypothetical protein
MRRRKRSLLTSSRKCINQAHLQATPSDSLPRTITKRSNLWEGHAVKLQSEYQFSALGKNGETSSDGVWFGNDGPYTNEYCNESGQDLILVIWGPEGSWVNVKQPLITASIANGTSTTISFATGQIGAWSAIYEDTKMLNGQICDTWGEYTFGPTGVVDISREPNMKGNKMTIVGPQCVNTMDICVFVCKEGDICMNGYELKNCDNGSQPGATYGMDYGAPSGGCGGLGESAHLKTYLS